jgi:two-component system nitrate/nitrite response regulator NarL
MPFPFLSFLVACSAGPFHSAFAKGHFRQQPGGRFLANPIGAFFPVPSHADCSGAAYMLAPATGEPPGPEGEQKAPSIISAAASLIRVFLLIENRLLRESLVRLFRSRPDVLVVGQSGHPRATARRALDAQCDVLVIDSLETRWFPANIALESGDQASVRAVVIAMDSDEEQFLAAVRSGVTGYLLQDASASDLVAAVRAVFRGEAVCPPQLCSTLFRSFAQMAREMPVQSATSRPNLTLRQQRLIALVAKGLTNKEIASHLNLSEFTVRNHIHRILKQVDAVSRSEAVEAIRSHGYVISP